MDVRESDVDRRDLRVETGGTFARTLTIVGLNATAMLHDATAAIRTAWQGLQVRKLLRGLYQPSRGFGDLAGYTSIIKHRKVAERFNFSDPFYRCHEESVGSKIFIDGREHLNFASYDYIGLNRHPLVSQAAKAAIDQFGTSVSASRIVSGERVIHRELESVLADLYEAQAALAFVSGHATNVSTIAALMKSADLVIHDELAHNSILVGAKLSGATVRPFRHNDMAALEKVLAEERGGYKNALIVVEGLYSMDGDIPDLPRLIELKQRHNAWLMVDEAHALGVLGKHGRGSPSTSTSTRATSTFGWALSARRFSACGGYIAGSHELIEILKFRAAGQVYSVGMSPPVAAAAAAALQLLKTEPERVARVQANGALFLREARAHGLDTVTSQGYAIIPIMVGDIVRAGRITDRMLARGVNVLPIIYPAVPLKAARLRFFVTSEHTPEQVRTAVRITAEELRRLA